MTHGLSYSFPPDSLLVKLTMKNKNIDKREDMILNLSIESMSKKGIIVPKIFSWGFLIDCAGTGYISIQVQKKGKKGYKSIQLYGTIDNLFVEDKFDRLYFNNKKQDDFIWEESSNQT